MEVSAAGELDRNGVLRKPMENEMCVVKIIGVTD